MKKVIHKTILACGVIRSFGGAGASQMHKGIPHLHSEMLGKGEFSVVASGLVTETLLISNLETKSVTALTWFVAPGTPSFFNLE